MDDHIAKFNTKKNTYNKQSEKTINYNTNSSKTKRIFTIRLASLWLSNMSVSMALPTVVSLVFALEVLTKASMVDTGLKMLDERIVWFGCKVCS